MFQIAILICFTGIFEMMLLGGMMVSFRSRFVAWWWVVVVLGIASVLFAGKISDFDLLNSESGVLLSPPERILLPLEFQPFVSFVRKYELKTRAAGSTKVSILSISINDYYRHQTVMAPLDAPYVNFPLPIILDTAFRILGKLPELYPNNDVSSLQVFYGRWNSDIPCEIRLKVQNPAVGGDYEYHPLVWNPKKKQYQMKNEEQIRTHGTIQ